MVSTVSKANQPNQSPELEITLEEFLQLPETQPANILMGKFTKNLCQMGNIVRYRQNW